MSSSPSPAQRKRGKTRCFPPSPTSRLSDQTAFSSFSELARGLEEAARALNMIMFGHEPEESTQDPAVTHLHGQSTGETVEAAELAREQAEQPEWLAGKPSCFRQLADDCACGCDLEANEGDHEVLEAGGELRSYIVTPYTLKYEAELLSAYEAERLPELIQRVYDDLHATAYLMRRCDTCDEIHGYIMQMLGEKMHHSLRLLDNVAMLLAGFKRVEQD